MAKYTFYLKLNGEGNTPEEAWENIVKNDPLGSSACPELVSNVHDPEMIMDSLNNFDGCTIEDEGPDDEEENEED